MYLSGSKWSMRKKRQRLNPWRIILLLILIGAAIYIERTIVPTLPPPFIPTLTPTRSPASFILEAESLFEAGKLSQAQDAYMQAIIVDPDEPDYYISLARVQIYSNHPEDGETNARNALLIAPNSAMAHAVLGWALDWQGGEKLVDARKELERALSIDPNSAIAHAYYAEILMDSAEYDDALTEARKAVQLEPNLLESQRSLGYVWEMTGNYDKAAEAYEAALRINPNLSILHLAVGNMYQAQGDIDRAIESYLRAVALDPTDAVPLSWIAKAYASKGDYGVASQYADEAVKQDPANAYLYGNLGRMYYKNNEFEKAIDALALTIHGGYAETGERIEGLQIEPEDYRVVEYYSTYGLALAKMDRCDLAVKIFEALLRGVPDDETTVFNAQEGLAICGEKQFTPTPETTLTPSP